MHTYYSIKKVREQHCADMRNSDWFIKLLQSKTCSQKFVVTYFFYKYGENL